MSQIYGSNPTLKSMAIPEIDHLAQLADRNLPVEWEQNDWGDVITLAWGPKNGGKMVGKWWENGEKMGGNGGNMDLPPKYP